MRELIALDLPGGPAFVEALQRVWDDGDAVLPVEQRLPEPARAALLAAARPHAVVSIAGGRAHDADRQEAAVVRRTWDADAPLTAAGDALVVATSGTTGTPKLVVHTLAGVTAQARAVHEHLGVDPTRDRWLACLPLAHVGGLGVVLRAVVTATPLDVLPAFDAEEVAAAPAALGTTLVSLVPTALDRIDPAPFRWIVLGGSADPVERPPNVVHTYGLTETGGGVVYGGRPLPGAEVRIDGSGAIHLRGPMLARGRRRPDGSVVPVTDPDGWLATGDQGSWTAAGLLHVDGRVDDLIVTGGENVWPAPVEDVLRAHPAVAEVMVTGRPDPAWGQRVVALVVPTDLQAPPSLDELRRHAKDRLPAYAAPRELELVAALPRTALGKLQRPTPETA